MTPIDDRPALPYSKADQLGRPEGAVRRKLRKRAGRARWAQLRRAKLSLCRVCQATPAGLVGLDEDQIRTLVDGLSDDEIDELFSGVSLHHIVQRGGRYGGADTEHNLAPVCGHGTVGCHRLVEERDPEACRAFVGRLTEEERTYAIRVGGPGFIEARYGVAA